MNQRFRLVCLGVAACSSFSTGSLAETEVGLIAHIDSRAAAFEADQRFDAKQQLSVGVEVRGALGSTKSEITYLSGVGYQLGAGRALGFVYDTHLLPLGLGLNLGDSGLVGVLAGGRFSGITASVPASGGLLGEFRSEVALFSSVLLALWVAPTWEGNSARRGGSPTFEFIDELSSGVALRFGDMERTPFGRGGAGLFIGGQYFERGDARGAGLVFGFGLNSFGAEF
ncbi:MAG: hypothetical protein KC492_37310 [Myxococcales bacterium]|nr:hypothetical protein [Myxococcales bacterium]MCB9606783.1 hypothetical protein [Polyangiaceae bacterium]